MPTLNVSVPHQLTQDDALRRIQNLIAQAKTEYADKVTILQESWKGNVGTFVASGFGHKIEGNITMHPSDVTLVSSLPAAAIFFKAKLEAKVREILGKALS
jgi:hypothetical protein